MRYLLAFIIILNYFNVCGQPNEHTFKKVIIEIDGMQVLDVNHITQDHQGYIWVQSDMGLIRYDGLNAKKYEIKRSDAASTSDNYINVLYVDDLGDLWIGTNSGLSRYNPDCDCISHFPSTIDDIPLTMVGSVTEDKNKNIWIGTRNGDLFQYVKENSNFNRMLHRQSDAQNLDYDGIWHVLADQNNSLWLGTNKGLIHYNISTGNTQQIAHDPTDPNSLVDNRISALYEDRQGQLLIGTFKSGFHIYDPKDGSLKRVSFDPNNPGQLHAPYSEESVFAGDPYVNLIHQDENGGYWIGTTGKGINYFNAGTSSFINYDFELVNPEILYALYEDRQGILWIGGGFGSGLFKADLHARKYLLNTDLTNVEAVYESPINPGILWVKSQETALSKLNLRTKEIKNYLPDEYDDKSITHNWVRSSYQENNNTLWVGLGNGGAFGRQDGNGGISRMDIQEETFTHFNLTRDDDGLDDFSYTVYSICEDDEGHLWLGAGPGGIFKSNKEKTEFKHFDVLQTDSRPREVFLNIARIDTNGDIWASDFAGEGTLYLYDKQQEKFRTFLKGFKMYNLLVDPKGWLLISTWEKGLIHLNPEDLTYTQYTSKDGLPSHEAMDITKGENNSYWVGTRMGPAKFDLETGKITPAGLPKRRYNSGIIKASNNQIYTGSSNGLYSFLPAQVVGNPYSPQLIISDLLISKTNYSRNEIDLGDLTLSHDQNDLSFKYAGLHFSNPEMNSYKYRLKPIYDNWLHVGSEQTARYFNLSPGSYVFEVRASNSDGLWNDKTTSLQFTITPPWWTTWWAYALYIITIAFIIYRVYHFQLSRKMAVSESKRLKEVSQLRNSLFTNITHEFRTPLTVIKGMASAIKSDLKEERLDNVENSLEMIDRNSDGLLQLVNDMLDLAKFESGNMGLQLIQSDVIPFLKYLSESFSSMAEENQISLTVYSEIDSLIMDFDANKITSIISNLLSNAIKFTPELGKIIVHINEVKQNESSYLYLKVVDNGIGIAENELENIFDRFYQTNATTIRENEGTGIGLALTKELIELMNGTIEVNSSLNSGSEFIVMIPITKKAPITENLQFTQVPLKAVSKVPSQQTQQVQAQESELPLVLIIEDNMDVAHYLKTCLSANYETIHAINGIEGIETALKKIPDIIITDVMMPGKDGFEVCESLKTDERTDHIPIIMLTAKASMEDRIKGLSHGADAYLAKPFNKKELFTRLDQLVAIRKKLIGKIQSEGFTTLLKKRTKDPKLQFLQKVEKLIHEDIHNADFGSADLSKKLLISDSQLYRKIKAITGKSTAVFIRSMRLKFAKVLLITTDKTISEVAYETGFNDPSWFSRAYKDEFGFSPSETPK